MSRHAYIPSFTVATLALCAVLAAGTASATSFAVLLSGGGSSQVLEDTESVKADDIVIDERPLRQLPADAPETLKAARRQGFRLYGPGDAHFGSITIRSRVGKDSKELYQWWLDTSRGQNIRKSISVIALKRDGSEARRFNFLDCFPTKWESGDYSPSSTTADGAVLSTLVCAIGSVELPAPEGEPGKPGNVTVTVDGAEDSGLARWAGGEPGILLTSLVEGQFHTTTPGHKYVDTLTLRGPLTSGRKAMCEWINATVKGQPWKRTVTVKEILKDGSDGKTFTYLDCFPTRYVFPAFSASGTGNLYEEVHIKPIRLDLS